MIFILKVRRDGYEENDDLVFAKGRTFEDAVSRVATTRGPGWRVESLGNVTNEELTELLIEDSTIDNPLTVIAALRYICKDFSSILSVDDVLALTGVQKKIQGVFGLDFAEQVC
mgnify:CR=1 FL=1